MQETNPSKIPCDFKQNDNKNIFSYNEDEIKGWVISRFNYIDLLCNHCLVKFFKPENEKIFRNVVLDGSVIPINAKLKILHNIGLQTKIIQEFGELSRIRNAFAHCDIESHVFVKLNRTEDGDTIDVSNEQKIYTLANNGLLKEKNAKELVERFRILSNNVSTEFINYYSVSSSSN